MAKQHAAKIKVRSVRGQEAKAFFDRQARLYLKISGREFIRRWDAGQFNGKSDTPAVAHVAMLLPFGR